MSNRSVASIAIILTLSVFLGLARSPLAWAQNPEAPAAGPVPRDSLGRPDLSGIWHLPSRTGGYGPGYFEAEPPPYRPEAAVKQQEFRDGQGAKDPQARCLLSGVPRIYSEPFPFRIVQLPDEVIIIHEAFRGFRMIPTDGSGHPEDLEPRYLGSSAGRWEGDTLVVDVRSFNDKTWLSRDGTHHSDQLQITERWTRTGPETIRYEATMTDPVVFTEPWAVRGVFRLRPNDRIREYECIEGLPGILD